MKKLSLVLATLLASQTLSAEDTNSWELNGNLRASYFSDTPDADGDAGDEMHDLAVGATISLTTPEVSGFKAKATLFTSQPLFGQSTYKDNKTNGGSAWLADSDGGSFSYIGEAYISGQVPTPENCVLGQVFLSLGKQTINTPFANPDDIGMARNTFEAYLVQAKPIDGVTVTAGRVLSWAGHDSGGEKGEFKDLTGGDGVSVFAINYANSDLGVAAQVWNYHLDDLYSNTDVNIAYGDATYTYTQDDMTVAVSGQYAQFTELNKNENDGTVTGGKVAVTYGPANIYAAMNMADGDFAPINGFGGGPFFTSSDVMTIASVLNDSSAMKIGGGYQVLDNLSVSAGFLTLSPDEGDDLNELDLGASLNVSDNLNVSLYFESWNQYSNSSNTNSETVDWMEYSIFANYSF